MSDADKPSSPMESKAEVIRNITKALIERRQLRGLTLEKVSAYLKIRMQYMKLIESGDWDQMLGEVYVRGFVKRYAAYLGLDADKLMAPYLFYSPTADQKAVASMTAQRGGEISRYLWVWVGLGVILLVGLFRFIKIEPSAPERQLEAPIKAPIPQPSVQPIKMDEKLDPSQHELLVYSQFPLWMRVVSKEKTFEGFIPQASTWTWKGHGAFSIRLGHTKNILMTFDGKTIPLKDNQKKVDLPE